MERRYIEFDADFPDDSVENEVEGVVVPSGKGVADQIARLLANDGVRTTTPEQHSHFGWGFEAAVGGRSAYLILQCPDPWLLLGEYRDPFLSWLVGGSERVAFEKLFTEAIPRSLRRDGRFRNVKTYATEAEMNSAAAARRRR